MYLPFHALATRYIRDSREAGSAPGANAAQVADLGTTFIVPDAASIPALPAPAEAECLPDDHSRSSAKGLYLKPPKVSRVLFGSESGAAAWDRTRGWEVWTFPRPKGFAGGARGAVVLGPCPCSCRGPGVKLNFMPLQSASSSSVLRDTWQLARRLAAGAWLPALLVYFVLVGGTFWASLQGTARLVNLCLMVLITGGVALWRWRRGHPLLPPTPLDGWLLVWLALLLLSTLTSSCRRLSFDVTLQQVWYFLLFYLTAAAGETGTGRRRFGTALTAACVAVVLVGLVQFGVWAANPLRDMTGAGQRVVRSTFNSPNDFASFLVMLLPLAAVGFLTVTRPVWQRAVGTAWFLAMLACVVLTYSRGGWLSAPLAVAVVTALLLRTAHLPRFRDLFLANKALVGMIVVGLLLLLRFSPEGWFTMRLESLVQLNDMGVTQRWVIWRAATGMMADRPWLGWGGGTFPVEFTRYLPPGAHRELPLHAHNQYLHYAAETGIPSALLFLLAAGTAVALGWRAVRRQGRHPELLQAACVAGAAAHLLFALFNADSAIPSLAGTFWMLLALGLGPSSAARAQTHRRTPAPVVAALAMCGLVLSVVCGRFLLAQRCYDRMLHVPGLAAKTRNADRAVKLDPGEPPYHAAAAAVLFRGGKLAAAVREMEHAVALSPHDALFWNNLGRLEAELHGPTQRSLQCAEQARRLDPGNPVYLLTLARRQWELGWPAEAEQTLRQGDDLRYALPEFHWELGKLLVRAGRWTEAAAELKTCLAELPSPGTKRSLPGYQVGPRYRRLPRTNEALTEVVLLTSPTPVRRLLRRCQRNPSPLRAGARGPGGAAPPPRPGNRARLHGERAVPPTAPRRKGGGGSREGGTP